MSQANGTLLDVMADETTNVEQTGAGADSAAPTADAPGESSVETTTDAPSFRKESFGEFLGKKTAETAPETKTEPTDDTPKPEESKEPVETKADEKKAEAPPEAPKTEEGVEADDDELELLSADEINTKFSNAPKGLRSYAAKVVEKFAPYAEVIDGLGGIEAAKKLEEIQTVALSAPTLDDGGTVDQLHDHLKALNPAMLESFQRKMFYSAIDDPKDAETLLNPYIQADERYKDWTVPRIKQLVDMVVDGHIDLEKIQEELDAEDPKAAEERRLAAEREAASEKRIAELEKKTVDSEEQGKQIAREKEVSRLWGVYGKAVEPVMKKFGLDNFIKPDDSPDIKAVKEVWMGDLGEAIGRRLAANPFFQALDKRIVEQDKSDGYALLVEKCAHIYKGVYREEVMKRQGMVMAYLKSYGKEVKETRRPEPEVDATKVAQGKTAPVDESGRPVREEGGLGKLIEKISAAEQAA